MNDPTLSEDMKSIFHVQSEARRIQFLGFSKEELKNIAQYVDSGNIYMEKILSGKEIILMAPMYEAEEEDGSVVQKFLTKDEYKGKSNQYKDTYYSVGDYI